MSKELTWNKLESNGDVPNPRLGHTMVQMDRKMFVMFGGLDNTRKEGGKISPNNQVFLLKVSDSGEAHWKEMPCEGMEKPLPRSNHAACKIGSSQMFVFGGLYSSTQRFNDVHILKCVLNSKKYTWSQPPNQKLGKKEPKNTESKIGAPAPRANHTATFVPNMNKVFIVGGHGGVGYSRKAFNDVHTYDVETHEWKKEDIVGNAPKERGGHTACLLPDGDKIFIYGGWNNSTQFENFYLYDCVKKEWVDLDTPVSEPCRWSHCATIVPALPESKLFIFGGSSESFEEGTARKLAKLSNSIGFINIKGTLKQSKWNFVQTDIPENNPLPRENSTMVYDEDQNRLLIFGGWSNKYMNDIHQIAISKITGPSYAIYSIKPVLGPYTGGTVCHLTGEGFIPNRTYKVNFEIGRHFLDVFATYVSATEIKCETPSFENNGPPKTVEVRVQQVNGDQTLTHVNFEYYYNTTPTTTLAFGPGLLKQNKTGIDTMFVVQARNLKNDNRKSGNDECQVEIFHEIEETEEDEEGEITTRKVKVDINKTVKDMGDGSYQVKYKHDKEGDVKIVVSFKHPIDKTFKPIRGAPYIASFKEDADAKNNKFTGPMMNKYMEERLKNISTFITETGAGIDTKDDRFKKDVKALLKIKESSQRISKNKDQNRLDLDVIEEALNHFNAKKVSKKPQLEQAKDLIKKMETLQEECTKTEQKISGKLKDERKHTEKDLVDFEKELKRFYIGDLKKQNYIEYHTGVSDSLKTIEMIEANVDEF